MKRGKPMEMPDGARKSERAIYITKELFRC